MAIVASVDLRNSWAEITRDMLQGGEFQLLDSADNILAGIGVAADLSAALPVDGRILLEKNSHLVPASSASAFGTAVKAKFVVSGQDVLSGYTVGTIGSGADLEMERTNILQGDEVVVESFWIEAGNKTL